MPVAEAHCAYLVLIRTLGIRTGELHNALCTTTGDFAFDPEQVTDADLKDWVQRVEEEGTATLDQLEHRQKGLAVNVREIAEELLLRRKAIAERLQQCISKPVKTVKTRYHGDYHLGQVLLAKNDFVIIDFEGEPASPLAERRRKHSPLRDIAGILRSFNYAAYTAIARDRAEQPEDLARFEPLVRDWETEVGGGFLTAYDETTHCSGLIAPHLSLRGLLDLFLLEKSLYEVRYELDNRPDWVAIPLRGIQTLLKPTI